MNDFKVSVIIPVYNASKYVTQAVETTLMQPETAEVILIEDGSTDDSLLVCQSLQKNTRRSTFHAIEIRRIMAPGLAVT